MLGFLGRCLLYWTIALVLVSRVPAIEEAGIRTTVATVERVFSWTGREVHRVGNALMAGAASVEIVADCSPHIPYLIFAAVVLAFPSSWRQRLFGLAFGAVVIHLFNTARILALMWVLIVRREWFEFAHVYLWQTGTILVLFGTFALWLRMMGRRTPRTTAAPPGAGAPA